VLGTPWLLFEQKKELPFLPLRDRVWSSKDRAEAWEVRGRRQDIVFFHGGNMVRVSWTLGRSWLPVAFSAACGGWKLTLLLPEEACGGDKRSCD
jgi:hypothetical protein